MTTIEFVLISIVLLAIIESAVALYIAIRPKKIIELYKTTSAYAIHRMRKAESELTYQKELSTLLGSIFSDLVNVQPGTIDSEIRIYKIANVMRILQETKGVDQNVINYQIKEAIENSPAQILKTVQTFINRYADSNPDLHAYVFHEMRDVRDAFSDYHDNMIDIEKLRATVPEQKPKVYESIPEEPKYQSITIPGDMEVGSEINLSGIRCRIYKIDWTTQIAYAIYTNDVGLFTLPDGCKFQDSILEDECIKLDASIPLDLKGVIIPNAEGDFSCMISIPTIDYVQSLQVDSKAHRPIWGIDPLTNELHSVAPNGDVSNSPGMSHIGALQPGFLIDLVAYGEYYDYMYKKVHCI